ncbi:MAG: PQQ-binding-like beta-propeller repeat protein [Armatimonadota bacterium]
MAGRSSVPVADWRRAVPLAAALCALAVPALLATCQPQRGTPEQPPPLSPAPTPRPADDGTWPRFRGPQGSGHAPFDELPLRWDAATGEGIAWCTPLPLPGANSPIIWGDRLFVTGADEARREVYCLHTVSGELLWTTAVAEEYRGPPPRLHGMTGYAPATGATDGERVYEVFPTGHVIALDFEGKPAWERWFDMSEDIYGHASSLVLHGDLLYVQIDLGKPDIGRSHLVALDRRSGETVWDIPRPVQGSWTTPIVINTGAREELVTSAKPWVIAYDPLTGHELWRVRCVEGDSAPSPIYARGHILVANIYAELTAIRPGGAGDVTATHVSWSVPGRLPDITSPLSDGELVWTLATNGLLSCYDAADGALLWAEALGARFRSSPSLVGGNVLLISEAGQAIIFAAEREYRQVGGGSFGEPVYSCPAFAQGRIYVRGEGHVFCVAGE